MAQVYDFIIDQDLNSNTDKNNLLAINDSEVVKMYKNKIQRKRGNSLQQRSQNYKVSRDFQVVFVKDNKYDKDRKTNRFINMLSSLFKRRLAFGIKKIKENNSIYEKSVSEWSISESDGKMPFDYKKMLEVFEDLDNIFKRKNQLSLVIGFIKISFEQKEIIRKRQILTKNLQKMRIEKAFSIFKSYNISKKSIGIQAQVSNEIPCQSIIQKVDSVTTILIDSFVSKDKTKEFINPFSKIKNKKIDFTSLNMEASKVSDTSLQTISVKMGRLQGIIKQARQIRESYNNKKSFLSKKQDEFKSKKYTLNKQVLPSSINIQQDVLPIEKIRKFININNFKQQQKKTYSVTIDSTKQNIIFNTLKNQIQETKRVQQKSSVTSKKQSKIQNKIHNIIQPVIQQIIQPIHYYHYPVNYFTQKSDCSQFKQKNNYYLKQTTVFHSSVKNKSPDFSRIYPLTPKPNNGYF